MSRLLQRFFVQASTSRLIWYRGYAKTYPPHTPVLLPALSPTMETGTIISWEKKEGDKLNEGDLLAEIETDKATMGLETPEEGFLARIVVPAGTKDVKIGRLVCVICENAEDSGAFADYTVESSPAEPSSPAPPVSAAAVPPPTPAPAPSTPATPAVSAATKSTSNTNITPFARTLALAKGLDLSKIAAGTGFAGAIRAVDLNFAAATSSVGAASASTDIKMEGSRVETGRRLAEAKQTIPHYYLTTTVDVTSILALRTKFSAKHPNLSLNDFLVKGMAAACRAVPAANSSWMGDFIREYSSVDVGFTVHTSKGPIAPVIRAVHQKGVSEIHKELVDLVARAKQGRLELHEYQAATISISSLSNYGLHSFSAIIPPPQACILAVGAVHEVATEKEGKILSSPTINVTLSCDHRVVDGAVGAAWLETFKSSLEEPGTLWL